MKNRMVGNKKKKQDRTKEGSRVQHIACLSEESAYSLKLPSGMSMSPAQHRDDSSQN